MKDLPKELFDVSRPGIKREYHFIDIYGNKNSVELGFGDSLSFIRCSLDGAHIIHYSGDTHTRDICPACNNAFEGNRESVVRYVDKNYSWELKERIRGMKAKLNQLEHILKLLENPSNDVKKSNLNHEAYNKTNLSEKETKIVNIKDYKSKKLKEAEERFYHLSDHLFPENQDEKSPNPGESA